MTNQKTHKSNSTIIALNKRVYNNYYIEKELEAGLVLEGWEVKALRLRKANISNSYVLLKQEEAFLFGFNCTQLTIISHYHYVYNPMRARKLLLNKHELNFLYDRISHHGYAIVVISLYWNRAWCKVKIGLARGKKQYEKRSDLKKREWQYNKARIMKNKISNISI